MGDGCVPAFALIAMRQHGYGAADLVRNARPSSNWRAGPQPINGQTPRGLRDNGWLHLMPGDSRELRMPGWLCGSSAELHP